MNTENAGQTSWEYPRLSGIKIQEITNKTRNKSFGTSYYIRIPARITGGTKKRFQRQSKQEAFTFAEQTYRAFQREGTCFNALTLEEKQEAALALKMAKDSGFNIVSMVKFASERMKPKDEMKTFSDVVHELYQIKQKCELKTVSLSDFKDRSHRLCELIGHIDIINLDKENITMALSSMTHG